MAFHEFEVQIQQIHVSIIAVRRDGHVSVNIDPIEPFHKEDSIYLLGDDKSLERICGA